MVIDKGLGPSQTDDLLAMAAPYIDFLKFGFGTSFVYPERMLYDKIERVKAAGVIPYPGGTSLEIAVHQGTVPCFLRAARDAGFPFVEVSEGTIDLSPSTRRSLISRAADMGFGVLSEVGKKDPNKPLVPELVAVQVEDDLRAGAFKVIVEGRDAGRSVGIFDGEGNVRPSLFQQLLHELQDVNDIIWEAPRPGQQQSLLLHFGPDASFGNVQPEHVITLEATRVGLRGDTLQRALAAENGDSSMF